MRHLFDQPNTGWFFWTQASPDQCPKASAENAQSALMLGLSVYTTLNWPARLDWFDMHWRRLIHHARYFGFLGDQNQQNGGFEHAKAVFDWLSATIQIETTLRLTCVPHLNHLGEYVAQTNRPLSTLLGVTLRPRVESVRHGLHVKTIAYERPIPFIKHGSIGVDLWQRRQAQAEDVIWVNAAGQWTEASTANIALLMPNRSLITPCPPCCLPGLAISWLAEHLETQDWQIAWQPITAEDVSRAEGLLLTNASSGFRPMAQVDDIRLPWPLSRQSDLRLWQKAWIADTHA
jgi:branched-subunit amino acid aminotransferase/4-amino-4-deoxychorismate lyase